MTTIYSARPTGSKRIVVSPGDNSVMLGKRHADDRPAAAMREPDWNRNAPVVELSEQFKAAMRAKGWLRD